MPGWLLGPEDPAQAGDCRFVFARELSGPGGGRGGSDASRGCVWGRGNREKAQSIARGWERVEVVVPKKI